MTDLERAQALWKMQEARCGYGLHAWTWEDIDGVVHLLDYYLRGTSYALRCDSRIQLAADTRVPYNLKMPTCVRCICRMAPLDER